MKLWTLRQEWNERERDKAFETYVKSELDGSLSFDEMLTKINLLPVVIKNTTRYLYLITDETDYKKFCQRAKELMRTMRTGRYEVLYSWDTIPGDIRPNDRVKSYLYATLDNDEV